MSLCIRLSGLQAYPARKIVVSTWRVVCRRLQTVSGVAFDLHQKAHDQSGKSTGRRSAVCPSGAGLHQRPGIPGIRSTFGTGTELLNSLRLMYSRLASHRCPNGHYVPPTLKVAAEQEIICPECGERVHAPSAEQLAFNSQEPARSVAVREVSGRWIWIRLYRTIRSVLMRVRLHRGIA